MGKTVDIADLTTHEKWVLYPVIVLIFAIGIHPDPLLQISEAAVTGLLKVFSHNSAIPK